MKKSPHNRNDAWCTRLSKKAMEVFKTVTGAVQQCTFTGTSVAESDGSDDEVGGDESVWKTNLGTKVKL